MRLCWAALVLVLGFGRASAQEELHYVLFGWDGGVYAQSIFGGDLRLLGTGSPDATTQSVFRLADAPVGDLPAGYGFYGGVIGPGGQFAYIVMQPGRFLVMDANGSTLLEGTPPFFVPLGFHEGSLLLLERHTLNHLHGLRVWTLANGALTMHTVVEALPRLHGRAAILPDGSGAFIGFDVEGNVGYTYDFATARVFAFQANLRSLPAINSVVDQTTIVTLGVVPETIVDALMLIPPEPTPAVAPFLRVPLADAFNRITCYPDSAFTAANFEYTCPGSATPRMYEGHQGTDYGGGPQGLPLDTPVSPAAPGVVLATFGECIAGDLGCANAYGNYVVMEHIVLVGDEAQAWHTGYTHLSESLVEPLTVLSDLSLPIGRSGETGIGGPHLHFEVRSPHNQPRWRDPWAERLWLTSILQ